MSGETTPSSELLRNTLDAYFAAIAALDPQRIASVFAKDGEIEIPSAVPSAMGGTRWRFCSPPG